MRARKMHEAPRFWAMSICRTVTFSVFERCFCIRLCDAWSVTPKQVKRNTVRVSKSIWASQRFLIRNIPYCLYLLNHIYRTCQYVWCKIPGTCILNKQYKFILLYLKTNTLVELFTRSTTDGISQNIAIRTAQLRVWASDSYKGNLCFGYLLCVSHVHKTYKVSFNY